MIAKTSKKIGLVFMSTMALLVTLVACKDDIGSIADKTPPEADFSFEADEADYQLIEFTNLSVSATSYLWDFGDNETSTEEHPEHKFTADGTYKVTLTASDANDETSSVTKDVVIKLATTPTAGFEFEADEEDYKEIHFTNTSALATSYEWDFGDGETSTEENPSHLYESDGTYTVSLTAIDEDDEEDVATMSVVVTNPEGPPVASYTYEADESDYKTIIFTNTSANGDSYSWDFGDGETSTDESPTHTFDADDTYSVQLTVTNSAGSDDVTQAIEIKARELFVPEIENATVSLFPGGDSDEKNENREAWRNKALETSADDAFGNGTWVVQVSSSEHTGDGGWSLAIPSGTDPLSSRRWAYQAVTVQDDVDYTLEFYVRQAAGNTLYVDIYDGAFDEASTIGDASKIIASATFNDASGHSIDSWVEATMDFNSGSTEEIVIFITNDYAGGNNSSRFDDFAISINEE